MSRSMDQEIKEGRCVAGPERRLRAARPDPRRCRDHREAPSGRRSAKSAMKFANVDAIKELDSLVVPTIHYQMGVASRRTSTARWWRRRTGCNPNEVINGFCRDRRVALACRGATAPTAWARTRRWTS
ncbi:hypothetical protein ACTMU2_27970 [Cupriavidus basilensis]